MKLFIRFFVSLCLLLLCGYGHLYAVKYQDHIGYTSINIIKGSERACFGTIPDSQGLAVNSSSSGTKHYSDKIVARDNEDEDEDDDDEMISFTRPLEVIYCFDAIFYPVIAPQVFCPDQEYVSSDEVFPYSSASRYLVLRVIRI